jgi:HEAT repeat protein
VDRKSTFIKRFGDLIALLRADPGNDAAQDLALAAAVAAVELAPLEVEAGIAWNVIPDELTLKGRLLARQVEVVRIAAGAEPHELLALARALSHDLTPLPCSLHVEVETVRLLAPPPDSGAPSGGHRVPALESGPGQAPRGSAERRTWDERRHQARAQYVGNERRRRGERRVRGERRLSVIRDQQAEITRLQAELGRCTRALAWEAVLAALLSLVRLAPQVPLAERRSFGIQVRRSIPRSAIEAMVNLADRDAALRGRAAEVLQWIGLEAAEVLLERLAQGEAIGVRGFYYEALGGMPGVYPLVTPLLASRFAHEIRHGAALLGRLGEPGGVRALAPLLAHPDESVRVSALRALGALHQGAAAETLREGLHHPDFRTRAAAAEAIAAWRGGALALLLVAALETERDREVWQAIVTALGRIGTIETCGALAGVALTRRSIMRRQGYTTGQRLAAVTALGLSEGNFAHAALERLAREGEGVVRYAAARVLKADSQRAG